MFRFYGYRVVKVVLLQLSDDNPNNIKLTIITGVILTTLRTGTILIAIKMLIAQVTLIAIKQTKKLLMFNAIRIIRVVRVMRVIGSLKLYCYHIDKGIFG